MNPQDRRESAASKPSCLAGMLDGGSSVAEASAVARPMADRLDDRRQGTNPFT